MEYPIPLPAPVMSARWIVEREMDMADDLNVVG